MKFICQSILVLTLIAATIACNTKSHQEEIVSKLKIEKSDFGTVGEKPISLYTLSNGEMSISIINYGGIITHINVPDKDGKIDDIAFGFDNIEGYLTDHPFFGALIGRYGNRIAKGKFSIDGQDYNFAINNAPNTLHGGNVGFDKIVWDAREIKRSDAVGVEISGTSPDMDEGYPGNFSFAVEYWLTEQNELELNYRATTDKTTHCNLTNHSYFNLNGAGNGDILDQILTIQSDSIVPVDQTLIPTGKLMAVAGTAFDFNQPTAIGSRISADEEQLKFGNGYDHNYVIRRNSDSLQKIAEARSQQTGRTMEVWTTEPGVQLYTGNFLDGSIKGKGGKVYGFRSGFCLETQHYPDSPNQPNFPSTLLKPSETYQSQTVYKFGVE